MLKLYQGNRLEYLADLLVELNRAEPPPPMQVETVVVPHAGMARWLSVHIAEQTGICANYHFPLPAGYIWETLNRLLPGLPESDPYAPAVMQWVLFRLLDEASNRESFDEVMGYLSGADERSRFELAAELANCFDQYLVYRPDWIHAWEAGRSAIAGDSWQAELWRQLRQETRAPHWVDLQQRLQRQSGGDRQRPQILPERISVFALPSLSTGYLKLLQQLSAWMDVHLYQMNPSPLNWSGIIDPVERSGRELKSSSDAIYLDSGNPLLASLGRQGRDFQAALLDLDIPAIDLFEEPQPENLLQALQSDIFNLRDGSQQPARVIDSEDISIQLHSCHSPMREVEVLHDRLLHLFESDPTLKPHQVVVMTPELERYAPYVDAVFAAASENPIPFSIADEGHGVLSSETAAFFGILELSGGRCRNDEVLALLEVEAVRRKFSIDEKDLDTLRRWVEEAGIRWGENAQSRSEIGLPEFGQNSWRSGMDRILLGYALSGDGLHCFEDLLPYAGAEGAESELLGNFSAFIATLFAQLRQLRGKHRLHSWSWRIGRLLNLLFEAEGEEQQRLQKIRTAVDEMVRRAALARFNGSLSLELVKQQLSQQLSVGGTAGGMLRSGVTFCGLTPARTLPFEVLCMIGMNDASFPSRETSPGFDLMSTHFRLGDRPRRIDDRYLFLEMLIAPRRALYVSYTGQDLRDNSRLTPSALVTELFDYLQHSFRFKDGEEIASRWPLLHPLQPFSAAYFKGAKRLFSYQHGMAEAAGARLQYRESVQPLLPRPLAEPKDEWRKIDLASLKDFFFNPTRYLLRERLGVRLERDRHLLDYRDPYAIGYFERERLGRQMIEQQLAGNHAVDLEAVERAAGRLPHAQMGSVLFAELQRRAEVMSAPVIEQGLQLQSEQRPFDLQLGPFRVHGSLACRGNNEIAGFSFNALPAGAQIGLWIEHLFTQLLAESVPGPTTRWLAAGEMLQLRPVENAEEQLHQLLSLYWQGLSVPLHLFPRSSLEYAQQRQAGKDEAAGLAKAWGKWAGGFISSAEFANPYYATAFPQGDVLDDWFMLLSEQVFGVYLQSLEAP